MKKCFVIGILILTVLFPGCSANKPKNEYKFQGLQDVTVIYKSIDDMAKDNPYIIKGKIVEAVPYSYSDSVFTKTKIKVLKSYKGNLKNNDTIDIVFRGGTLTGREAIKNYFMGIRKTNIDVNSIPYDAVTQTVENLDNFQNGDELFLFMDHEYGEFGIAGGYQGRLKVMPDKSVQLYKEITEKYQKLTADQLDGMLAKY